MYYDLHIHSVLSPCASDDMTPNNIVRMAKLQNLDVIAVCDHNSVKQQPALHRVAEKENMQLIYGIEVQTIEEVHILCYFRELSTCMRFGQIIDRHLLPGENNVLYFGNQQIMNEFDELISEEQRLLINSIDLSVEEVCNLVHGCGGSFVLAHALNQTNSIMTQLGFIPSQLKVDGIEVRSVIEKQRILVKHPWLADTVWLYDSDAHYLTDINEAIHELTKQEFDRLWRVWP